MSKPCFVLDASALLAWLQGEPGGAAVGELLVNEQCVVSAANLAEIITRSLDRSVAAEDLRRIIADLDLLCVEVSPADGAQAGWLRASTRSLGLSLGDRLCLATAQRLKATVVTADRPWLSAAPALGLDIRCIRPDQH